MGTKIRHGELEIALPAGWTDRSTLLFERAVDPLAPPTLSRVVESTPTISVRFFHREQADPREVLAEELRRLQDIDSSCVLLRQGPFEAGLGEGWHIVHQVGEGEGGMHQLLACFCLSKTVVLACAQTNAHAFSANEALLREILHSLSASPCPPQPAQEADR